jgi:hypothetical protein
MAEMTRPRAQTGAGAQAAGYGHQRRTPSIASEISLAAAIPASALLSISASRHSRGSLSMAAAQLP